MSTSAIFMNRVKTELHVTIFMATTRAIVLKAMKDEIVRPVSITSPISEIRASLIVGS